jgi:LysR family transcriptional regulator, transcription activator of glutamate synthase operon
MGMQVEALRWFQQVADGITVTEVSEVEQITQSGVSRALARLERELGTPLLQRSGRLLRMTRAGAAFKRHVDALLHDLDDGLAAVSQLVDPDTGSISVAFQGSLGTWLVPDLVGSFRESRPQVRFLLEQMGDESVSALLGERLIDLEISALRPSSPALRWRPFLTEPLVAAVPRAHPLADRASIRLEELAQERFVGLRPAQALRRLTDELCEAAGFAADVVFESGDLSTVQGFVSAGLGVAVVPAPRSRSPYAGGGAVAYLPLDDPRASRQVGVVWSAERRLLPSAEAFRRHVLDRARAGLLPPILT